MARFNLRFAAHVVRDMATDAPEAYRHMVERVGLDPAEPEAWERAAEAMHIPYSPAFGIHPQDSLFLEREVWDLEHTPKEQRPLLLHFHPLVIYRFQVLKQADVVLALYLQGNHFTAEEKLADFDYYDPLTTGDSTLSAVVQSILAAEVGYQDLALRVLREVDLRRPRRPAPQRGRRRARRLGGRGVDGARRRLRRDARSLRRPHLRPSPAGGLARALVRAALARVAAADLDHPRRADGPRARPGDPVTFEVRGVSYTASPGNDVVAPLAGQGPVLPGRPSLRQWADVRREDGTLLSASVPTVTVDDSGHHGLDARSRDRTRRSASTADRMPRRGLPVAGVDRRETVSEARSRLGA